MSVAEGAWDLISGELGLQSDLLFLSLGRREDRCLLNWNLHAGLTRQSQATLCSDPSVRGISLHDAPRMSGPMSFWK